jgi:hypothetical protein
LCFDEHDKKKKIMATETVEFGVSSSLEVDLDNLVDKFFEFILTPGECEEATMTLEEIEKFRLDMDLALKNGLFPDVEGNIRGKISNSTGGLRDILKTLARIIYKIVGFFAEQFIAFLEPIQKIIGAIFQNTEIGPLNFTTIPNIIYFDLKIVENFGNPESIKFWLELKIQAILDMVSSAKKIGDILNLVIEAISDLNAFLNSLLEKILGNFTIPIPSIPLGFAGIELPAFDKKDLFGAGPDVDVPDFDVPGGLLNLLNCAGKEIDLDKLVRNPQGEIRDSLGLDIENSESLQKTAEMVEIDLSEIEFYQRIQRDPVQQLDYINAIKEFGRVNEFYRDPYVDDKFQYTFDFFQKFELADLFLKLEEAELLTDQTFILDFYNLLNKYTTDNLPEQAEKFIREYNQNIRKKALLTGDFNFQKDLMLTVNDFFLGKLTKENLSKEDLVWVLSRSFEYNFWNTIPANDTKDYLYGETVDTDKYVRTNWNYKDFKLQFWNLFPQEKLKFFQSFIDNFVVNFEEFEEYQDNLSNPFFEVLRLSNDQLIGGDKVTGEGATKVLGVLSDNAFRQRVKLPPTQERLFPEENYDEQGIPNFRPSTIQDIFGEIKDLLPGCVTWVLSMVDFIKNIIMMPLNLLLGFIETFIGIIKDAISFNIPGVIEKITKLIKGLKPNLDFFANLIKPIIDPFLEPLFLNLKENTKKAGGSIEGLELFICKINNLITKGIPEFILNTIIELFNTILNAITGAIPFIST